MTTDNKRPTKAEQAAKLRAKLATLEAELQAEENARLQLFGAEIFALVQNDTALLAALLPKLQARLSVKNSAQLAPLLLRLRETLDAGPGQRTAEGLQGQPSDAGQAAAKEAHAAQQPPPEADCAALPEDAAA